MVQRRIFMILSMTWVIMAETGKDYPEGYYSFHRDPTRIPPSVRKPPYTQTEKICPGLLEEADQAARSLDNLCGDLNSGQLPKNPLGQNVLGASYPFELIKNQTLDLFSKTLPVLKEDKTLPKVAKFVTTNSPVKRKFKVVRRPVRSLNDEAGEAIWRLVKEGSTNSRQSRQHDGDSLWDGVLKGIFNGLSLDKKTAKSLIQNLELDQRIAAGRGANSFCRDNWGLFCLLYNTMVGSSDEYSGLSNLEERRGEVSPSINTIETNDIDGTPMTPCPSTNDYVTPVFARNHQGVWRYVVQIPYEGYFTQTVEVTQCAQDTCHYMSGSCLASPRWVSLLVAEIFYPDAVFPNRGQPVLTRGPVKPNQRPNAFQKRQGGPDAGLRAPAPHYCDGVDQIGCFQVRLYYDWFLVPGSCKCWKRNSLLPTGRSKQ